ncbi:MAG: hypothetical protein QXV97_07455, partial [Candidatus Caldarchaeum sp.]
HNPLGVKGIGEDGTIEATPAVANAVIDALKHLGITHLDTPLKPEKNLQSHQGSNIQKVDNPRLPLNVNDSGEMHISN